MNTLLTLMLFAIAAAAHARQLGENELRDLLTAALPQERGELELRLARPWTPLKVADGETVSVKVLDLPATGINANFILRFELSTERAKLGAWQLPVQAKLWRKIWVARGTVTQGRLLADADLVQERRDILSLREPCWEGDVTDTAHQIAQHLSAGAPLYARSVRLRPVVHRGQTIEARFQSGALAISMRVEVLEEGAPGQVVRVRNVRSQKEFRGKVQDENTILVSL